MDRNYEFEVEYLIGVLAALFAALNLKPIKGLVNHHLVYITLLIIVVHIILMTLVYSLNRGVDFEIEIVTQLEQISSKTLLLSAISFLAFVPSIMAGVIYDWFPSGTRSRMNYVIQDITIGYIGARTFIVLYLPIIATGIGAWIFRMSTIDAIRASRNIEISVVPEELQIRSEFKDSRPLSIVIRNRSDFDLTFNVRIEIPSSVEWREGTDNKSVGGFQKNDIVVESGRQKPIDLEFRYPEEDRLSGEARITIEHDYGEYQKSVSLLLDPY